jgi:hypothetical protein
MKQNASSRWSLLLATLAYAALSGGCNSSSTQGAAGLTNDKACSDLATAQCNKIEQCEKNGVQARYGDITTCLSRQKLSCMNGIVAPGTGNTPTTVEACVVALSPDASVTYDCADYINANPPVACQAQTGTVANGQACAFNAQCKTAFCALPKGSNCGLCAATPKEGDSCSTITNCGYTLVCSGDTQVCMKWGASGDSCVKGAGTCAYGLGCAVGANLTTGTCQPWAKVGAACGGKATPPLLCDNSEGLACVKGLCVVASKALPGQSCGNLTAAGADAGTFAVCSAASACNSPDAGPGGTCEGPAGDNQSCNTAADVGCMNPARCVGTATDAGVTGTCLVPTSDGCH